MSLQNDSDEDNSGKELHKPALEHLVTQVRMKTVALQKATNLIDLLTIELEVQKNSHADSLHSLEENLTSKYQTQINSLLGKIDFLQKKLKGRQSHSVQKNGARHNPPVERSSMSLLRTNSHTSISSKSRRAPLAKCQTELQISGQLVTADSLQKQFYKKQVLADAEWQKSILLELEELAEKECPQTQEYKQNIESMKQELIELCQIDNLPKKETSSVEYRKLIQQQQIIIERMRRYQFQLETVITQLSNTFLFLNEGKKWERKTNQQFDLQQTKTALVNLIHRSVKHARSQGRDLSNEVRTQQSKYRAMQADNICLKSENEQLKSILDSMIQLVREQKKIKL